MDATTSPHPNTPHTGNPNHMLVSDDGDVIRVSIRGATWLLPKEIASILRAQRARHSGAAADAFIQGFLLAGEIAHEIEKSNGARNAKED